MQSVTGHINEYFTRLKTMADRLDREAITRVINVLIEAYEEDRQLIVMGNGGSGSTASHWLNDFNKSACYESEKKVKVICINDNIPLLLALSNDIGYESVFVEQLKTYLRPGDVVIALSGSGNSKNVLQAIDYANAHGAVTVGLCGYSGGALKQRAQHAIHVPIDDMQISEDLHLSLMHLMMRALQAHIRGEGVRGKPN